MALQPKIVLVVYAPGVYLVTFLEITGEKFENERKFYGRENNTNEIVG